MNEKLAEKFKEYNNTVTLEERCPIHDIPLIQVGMPKKVIGEEEARMLKPFCPECSEIKIKEKSENNVVKQMEAIAFKNTYDVLLRESKLSPELKDKGEKRNEIASFDNFIASTPEEQDLLSFAKKQAEKYLDGMVGNTLITGDTGIGKSHLALSLGMAINEGYKDKHEPKSVFFISMTHIIKKIKNSWHYGKGADISDYEIVKFLTEVDYLILDDLGTKDTELKTKSTWEQDLLFDILNERENTIITTNLGIEELIKVYNKRNASRIIKGLEGNDFKAVGIKDKRYYRERLRAEEIARKKKKP